MNDFTPRLSRQATIVIEGAVAVPDVSLTPVPSPARLPAATTEPTEIEISQENLLLRMTVSSEPVFFESEATGEYQELEEALSNLIQMDDEDEWKIEPLVYNTACYIAAGLLAGSFPAPRVFTHGPKSVVFNWSEDVYNLYLTVSADRLSALISSPERIERRIECLTRELVSHPLTLSSIKAAFSRKPVTVLVSGAASDSEAPVPLH